MPNENYTLTNILRTGLSPLSAMIGTSAYYGQLVGSPILGSINALLFSKKLIIDIWHLNQVPSIKTKLFNSSKKILLGLGTITLINYSKFTNVLINPTYETTTQAFTTTQGVSTTLPSTTPVDPFPPFLKASNDIVPNELIDFDTYISLNAFGISNIINGINEFIPNRFDTIKKIANLTSGVSLISSGVNMGINNNFNNFYAIPTIIAGVSEITHNLLPVKTTHTNDNELQETTFTDEQARLINACDVHSTMGSMDTISLNSDTVIWDRSNPYSPTTMHL